jgi:hypothetical protein
LLEAELGQLRSIPDSTISRIVRIGESRRWQTTDGSFSYTPDAGYHGVDSFTYSVSDGALSSAATATLNVNDQAPVAVNDTYTIPQDGVLHAGSSYGSSSTSLLASDSDPDSGDAGRLTTRSSPARASSTAN